jgi:predicted transcriptional regulator
LVDDRGVVNATLNYREFFISEEGVSMPKIDDPLRTVVAQIVSAHVAHNDVRSSLLPGLIREVYQALAGAAPPSGEAPAQIPGRRRSTGQSVFDDHLVCMDCGANMKMLKRHLQTVHRMSPAQYRAKWSLPSDYPMVARQYATLRSKLAKESGLGKRPAAGRW